MESLEQLKKDIPENMWLRDLQEFETAYKKHYYYFFKIIRHI